MDQVRIFDTTLRDGEQSPGISLDVAEKLEIADQLPTLNLPFDQASLDEAQEFLKWIADDHFTFVGYREYRVVEEGGDELLKPIENTGLGIMRGSEKGFPARSLKTLAASDLEKSGSVGALILTKTNSRSRVHRPGHMDYLSVLGFDASGKPVLEQRFLGLLTSSAYMTPPRQVPLLRKQRREQGGRVRALGRLHAHHVQADRRFAVEGPPRFDALDDPLTTGAARAEDPLGIDLAGIEHVLLLRLEVVGGLGQRDHAAAPARGVDTADPERQPFDGSPQRLEQPLARHAPIEDEDRAGQRA